MGGMAFDLSEVPTNREFPTKDGLLLRDAIGGEFKDVDEGKRQVLVTFPHDTVDTYKTTFGQDAFRESFQKRMPLMAWQHDLRDPIGHAIDAQVLPRSNDLVGQFSDFDAVPNSKRAFSQIQDGTITDFSFGFRQPTYEPHRSIRGVRNIRQATMMEFSPVSIGSIPGAIATGLREEEFMSEHSAAEIAQLVEAKLISVEAGQRMLAEIPGYREYITIVSPEQKDIAELKDMVQRMMSDDREPGKKKLPHQQGANAAAGHDGGSSAPIHDGDGEDPGSPPHSALKATIAKSGHDDGDEAEFGDDDGDVPDRPRFNVQHKAVTDAGHDGGSGANIRDLPEVITADEVIAALPNNWQQAIRDAKAVFAIAPEGTEFFRNDEIDAESAGSIASAIEAAHDLAGDWMKDVNVRELPEEVQQAVQLWNAAKTSTDALLTVLGVEERAAGTAVKTGAENMAPTKVKCLTCAGSGESEDGKTCPTCMGSGIVAMTRDDMPEGAPDNASKCPTCKGSGKMHAGHMKCADCKGKGWMTREDVEDAETRADTSQWSDKPWSDFKQSAYSADEWKRACLIVDGDGATKDQCKLPVREPDGTYNVNGIAAAAGRISQVSSDGDSVADAADALTHLYSRMNKEVPPEVAKLAHRADMPDLEALEAQREAAMALLNRRVPAAAS
jgi:phage head maturation protease